MKNTKFGPRHICELNTATTDAATITATTTITTTQSKFRFILKAIISSLLEHILTVLFIYYDFSEPVILN